MRIEPNKIYQALLFISLIQWSFISEAQNIKDKMFEREELKFYKEKTDTLKELMLIKRENCKSIVFSFFEEFNDTVVLFVNNKKQGQWVIHTKYNPVESSGHSGIDYSFLLKRKRNTVVIKLLNQKKYVEFIVDKAYPLYSIQRYSNTWYINGRKYKMILK